MHRPVEPRGDLFDMGRLAGAVIALDHHAAIVGKARQDRQRGVRIEDVGLVEIGHALVRLGEGRDLHVDIDAECLADVHFGVGRGHSGAAMFGVGHLVHLAAA